ncbi:Hint domain-containing protein [Propioniciclava soli]|uniref:Hint domain-containing protein n=1 Tax=Propioniciclava soli TaxID=2775081 RepID=UPI001E477899
MIYTYDHPVLPEQAESGTSMSLARDGATAGLLSPLEPSKVAANSGRRAAQSCLPNSFSGETLVLMADGSKKPIKDVKLGDKVMASDPLTGERGPRRAVDLIRHGGLHSMVAVPLADGTTIDATDHHPFWVKSRDEWVDAIELQSGDVMVAAEGSRRTVASMGVSEQDLTAYNLTIAGLHTYFAGDDSVLVHNTGCTNISDLPTSAVRNFTEDANYAFSGLSQNHGVTRIEFREQIRMIKRDENLPADFNLSFGPNGNVWTPRTGELIGGLVHGP